MNQYSQFPLKLLLQYVEMFLFYFRHPILAVRDIMGIHLAPHQRIAIRIIWHNSISDIVLLFSRGMGKTFIDAILGILFAIFYWGIGILFLGGDGFRQGKLVLEKAAEIINGEVVGQEERYFLKKCVNRRPNQAVIAKDPDVWSIPWTTKSIIRTAPIGDGSRIRGFRSNVVFKDERNDLPNEIDEKVISAFNVIKRPDFFNRNINSGTLEFEEDDYTQMIYRYKELMEKQIQETGKTSFLMLRFEYIDAFRLSTNGKYYSRYWNAHYDDWQNPYPMDMQYIEDRLFNGHYDEETWNSEYRCLPKRAVGNVFTAQDVRNITDHELISEKEEVQLLKDKNIYNQIVNLRYLRPQLTCSDPVIIGIDVARESANTAMVALRLGPISEGEWDIIQQTGKTKFCNVINAYQKRNALFKEQALKIYEWLEKYPNCLLVVMDQRGGGSAVRDELYNVGKEMERPILYDPNDDSIASRIPEGMGDPRLRLLTYTNEDNTMALNRVRAAVQRQYLLLVKNDNFVSEPELKESYEFIRRIGIEMRQISTEPSGGWLKIVVRQKNTIDKSKGGNTKDLWTALMYAYNEAYLNFFREDESKDNKVLNIAGFIKLK